MLGSAVLYRIEDGHSRRDPLKFLIGSTPETLAASAGNLHDDGTMANCYSCYLFDNGTHRIMIDSGFGANAPADQDAGHMPDLLETLGYAPTDIDHVVFTHLHPDHILGSLTSDRDPFFANATHWTVQREVAHWRGGTDDRSRMIAGITEDLDSAGVLNAVEQPGAVVPGVVTEATYGHSPGHVCVRVSSGDDTIVISGDVTFSPMQLKHPDWSFPMDVDPDAAVETRIQFFKDRAADGFPFAAGHYGSPGLGRVVPMPDGLTYEPMEMEAIQPL